MDCYLLTLYVSVEQELAIRELFVYNGWNFNKYEDSEYERFSSKPSTSPSLKQKDIDVLSVTDSSQSKSIDNERTGLENPALVSDNQKEIFSDLQHFVEATLIAVSSDCNKTEHSGSHPALNNNNCPRISVGNQSFSSVSVAYTAVKGNLDKCSAADNNEVKNGGNTDILITKPYSESDTRSSNILTNENKFSTEFSSSNTDLYKKEDSESVIFDNTIPRESQDSLPERNDIKDDYKSKRKRDTEENVCMTRETRNKAKSRMRLKEKNLEKSEDDALPDTKVISGRKSKVGLFHCKECDNTFKFLGAFKNHKKEGKCLFICEYCGKSFTSRYYSNYQSHLKYHVKERPHKCTVCGKTYIEAQTLKIHMRKHSGDRPYVCHHCGLQFYSSSNLLSHRNSAHSDIREFHKCDICDARLSTLGNLTVHKKVVHAVERPFTCEICGKSFKTQKSLVQVHAKVHSEDFPYKCELIECGKTFKRSEGLADHMRRHNNDRNHFCDKCGKGFYTNKELILHTRTHTGEKPYMCQLCDYKCALAGNLRKHMKTHSQ